MALKNPLVLMNGYVSELLATDSLLANIVAKTLSVRNTAGTFVSALTSLATAYRTVYVQDKDYTLAGLDDIFIESTKVIDNYNVFSPKHQLDSINTNVLCGRGSIVDYKIDGVATDGSVLTNLNYAQYGLITGFATSVHSLIFNNEKFKPAYAGITYCTGFFTLHFYSDFTPAVLTARTKDRDGVWLAATCTLTNYATWRIDIATLNYLVELEYTLSGCTNHAFWSLTQIQYHPDRIDFGVADVGAVTSASGYLGGTYKVGKNAYFSGGIAILAAALDATPRQGLIEYDGTKNPYFTDSVSRKKLSYLTDIPVVTYPTSTATSINLSTVFGTSLALTVTAGLAFAAGDNYRVYSSTNQANYIECSFVSYATTTLTVLVEFVRGTATFTDGVITKSTGVFGTYLTADFSNNTTTAQNVVPFLLFGEAGVMYNIKISGCYSSNAINNGAYINTLSGVAATYLTGKAWMSNDNSGTSTATESVMSFNTSTSRFISKTTTTANATPYAVGMDFNVILPTSANIYVRFACTTGGITSNLLTGTSIIITRLKA